MCLQAAAAGTWTPAPLGVGLPPKGGSAGSGSGGPLNLSTSEHRGHNSAFSPHHPHHQTPQHPQHYLEKMPDDKVRMY